MIQREKPKNDALANPTTLIVIAVIAVALVVAIAAIILSNSDPALGGTVDYSDIPQTRLSDGGYILGSEDAPVTIVAFEDFLCPHCQDYQKDVKEFIKTYVATGKARFEFRMLPTQSASSVAMGLAECAEQLRPGSFWTAHDTLFQMASAARFTSDRAREFADKMDLSYTELLACYPTADQYTKDQQLATRSGVTGTPTVMIRLSDGVLQASPMGTRPDVTQLGAFVERYQ